ncbi:MAG: PEP-CTERM sorting domain-containing protein [Gemmatimonadetes bacterium]|nr:PEP-CTERM sorting domain-containing protein [Gemmatimonadota bacterium]
MRYKFWVVAVTMVLLLAAPQASGGVIVSLVGDKDNFAPSAGDPTGMDVEYSDWPRAYIHNYVLGGMVPVSASLTWHALGVGTKPEFWSEVWVNSNVVWSRAGFECGALCGEDLITVAVPLAYLTLLGSETITMQWSNGDVAMLDYTELSISDIPEPTTWALIGAGLLAVAGLARRRRRA